MHKNTRRVQIEWGDCDPAGIVYYPRYFAMFDTSTAHLFSSAGFDKFAMLKKYEAVGFPMVDTQAKFYIPSKYGDEVAIVSEIEDFGTSSFKVIHNLMKGDKLAIECWEKRVWVVKDPQDPDKITSAPIPEALKLAMSNNG
jgi:4-hydroxybenzoyl-CoA thioesterase